MKKSILIGAIFLFISTGFAEAPVAEQPTYHEGDTWVFMQKNIKKNKERKIKLEFLRMDGDNYVFLKNGKKEVKWDSGLTSFKRKEHGRYPGPVIRFPLKQGKRWDYTHLSGKYGGPDITKRSTKRTTTFEVVAYEEVTVPAGTFGAYRIIATVEGGAGQQVKRGTHTYWYAPDVKQIIKSHEFRIGTMELLKYTLK
jgi:hypothetical protein